MNFIPMPSVATSKRLSEEITWLYAAHIMKNLPILDKISSQQPSLHRVQVQFSQPLPICQGLEIIYMPSPHSLYTFQPLDIFFIPGVPYT